MGDDMVEVAKQIQLKMYVVRASLINSQFRESGLHRPIKVVQREGMSFTYFWSS